jgi:hypothetical protein
MPDIIQIEPASKTMPFMVPCPSFYSLLPPRSALCSRCGTKALPQQRWVPQAVMHRLTGPNAIAHRQRLLDSPTANVKPSALRLTQSQCPHSAAEAPAVAPPAITRKSQSQASNPSPAPLRSTHLGLIGSALVSEEVDARARGGMKLSWSTLGGRPLGCVWPATTTARHSHRSGNASLLLCSKSPTHPRVVYWLSKFSI